MDDLERGPYNEIYPPLLVAGMYPEEMVGLWAKESGMSVTELATGNDEQTLHNLALVYVQQRQIGRAIAGDLDSPEARALYRAVVEDRQRMSLRPLGQEALTFAEFAPVLQRVDEQEWRVGSKEEDGWTNRFQAPLGQVVEKARRRYAAWSQASDGLWQKRLKKALTHTPFSLFHDYWTAKLCRDGEWRCGDDGFAVAVHGGDALLRTPDSVRILPPPLVVQVRACHALAHRAGVNPVFPTPDDLMGWMASAGISPIVRNGDGDAWGVGDWSIAWISGERGVVALIKREGETYILDYDAARGCVVLSPAEEDRRDQVLAGTAVERRWLNDEGWRKATMMWAVWVMEGGQYELRQRS